MTMLARNTDTGLLYRGSGGKLCRGCCPVFSINYGNCDGCFFDAGFVIGITDGSHPAVGQGYIGFDTIDIPDDVFYNCTPLAICVSGTVYDGNYKDWYYDSGRVYIPWDGEYTDEEYYDAYITIPMPTYVSIKFQDINDDCCLLYKPGSYIYMAQADGLKEYLESQWFSVPFAGGCNWSLNLEPEDIYVRYYKIDYNGSGDPSDWTCGDPLMGAFGSIWGDFVSVTISITLNPVTGVMTVSVEAHWISRPTLNPGYGTSNFSAASSQRLSPSCINTINLNNTETCGFYFDENMLNGGSARVREGEYISG